VQCQLDWKRQTDITSGLYLVTAPLQGRQVVDSKLAEEFAPAAKTLLVAFETLGLLREALCHTLLPLSAQIHGSRQLSELALAKLKGRSQVTSTEVAKLAGAMIVLDQAVDTTWPDLEEQLQLRSGPLVQQWQARGPGLLRQISQLTDESLMVPRADVVLVYPSLGGAGEAHLSFNSVHIEAVLTNPVAPLPKPVRLVWLISQLNNDLPMFSESIAAARLRKVAALAMIPPTLAAAELVDWSVYNQETVGLALQHWMTIDVEIEAVSAQVRQWWEMYQAQRPSWAVALGALDQMIGTCDSY